MRNSNKLFIALSKEHAEKVAELQELVRKMRVLTPLRSDPEHGYIVSGQMKVDVSTLSSEQLEKIGIQVGARIQDVWSFKAPYQSVEALQDLEGVHGIRLDKKLKLSGSISRPENLTEEE